MAGYAPVRTDEVAHLTKKPIDWTLIEHNYRAGVMSVRDLAKWYSVSKAAVRKRAKAGQWTRSGDAPKAPVKKAAIRVTYAVTETAVTSSTTDPEEIAATYRQQVTDRQVSDTLDLDLIELARTVGFAA